MSTPAPTTAPVVTLAQAVPLAGPHFQQEPSGFYEHLRRQFGPVAPVLLDGVPAWLVLGYEELRMVTTRTDYFGRDSRRWNLWPTVPQDWPHLPMIGYQQAGESVLYAEGDEHQRRAHVVAQALRPIDMHELRTTTARWADFLLDQVHATGAADLVAAYTNPLPVLVLAHLMGFNQATAYQLMQDITTMLDGGPDSIRGQQGFRQAMVDVLGGARERPGADIPTRMSIHPAALTDEQIVQDLMVVMAAGHQPTALWIATTLRLMLTPHPVSELTRGRLSITEALNRVLWDDTPTQNFAGRWAAQPGRLGNASVSVGDMLILGLAGANTDPRVRPKTAELAGNRSHLSYSLGQHGCPDPARQIAEAIAKTAVGVVLDRMPDVELAVTASDLTFRPSLWMRGLTALPVSFTPRPLGVPTTWL